MRRDAGRECIGWEEARVCVFRCVRVTCELVLRARGCSVGGPIMESHEHWDPV